MGQEDTVIELVCIITSIIFYGPNVNGFAYHIDMLTISLECAILAVALLQGVFISMARQKRNKMTAIGVSLDPKTIGELSELSEVLDRSVSEIAREMILSDMVRFKDRHRQAIRAWKQSDDEQNRSESY